MNCCLFGSIVCSARAQN